MGELQTSCSNTADQPGEVLMQLARLNSGIADVRTRLNRLEEKIAPILTQVPIKGEDSSQVPASGMSTSIGEMIYEMSAGVERIGDNLIEISSRVNL